MPDCSGAGMNAQMNAQTPETAAMPNATMPDWESINVKEIHQKTSRLVIGARRPAAHAEFPQRETVRRAVYVMRALHTVHEVHDAPGVVPKGRWKRAESVFGPTKRRPSEIVEQARAVCALPSFRQLKALQSRCR